MMEDQGGQEVAARAEGADEEAERERQRLEEERRKEEEELDAEHAAEIKKMREDMSLLQMT